MVQLHHAFVLVLVTFIPVLCHLIFNLFLNFFFHVILVDAHAFVLRLKLGFIFYFGLHVRSFTLILIF